MRAEHSARRDALVEALSAHAPNVRVSGLAAGFHAVAHLPDGTDEDEVVARARALGVGVYGMAALRSNAAGAPPRLVLGFGNTSVRAIRRGIATIAPVLNPDV